MDLPSVDFRILLGIKAACIDIWFERLITSAVMQIGRDAGYQNKQD